MQYRRAAMLAVVVLCAADAAAGIFKCIDSDGAVMFQDRACDAAAQQMLRPALSQPTEGLRESERAWLRERAKQHSAASTKTKPGARRGAAEAQDKACWGKRQQLQAVRAKLRRGYKPSQGDKLRRQRSAYQDYLFRYCD